MRKNTIEHSLNAWATALGVDQQTLERRMIKAGFEKPSGGWGNVPFKTIYVAIMGDEQAEKIRNLKIDADRKEREERERVGELFPMAELDSWIQQHYITPTASIVSAMPSTIDTRCNPEHPEIARRVLDEWVENSFKPQLKTALEKPKA